MKTICTFYMVIVCMVSEILSETNINPKLPVNAENLNRCDFRILNTCHKTFGKKPTDMTEDEFSKAPCFCDEDCHLFGDCCIDSPFSKFWPSNTTAFTCVPLGKIDYHIYIKTKCSNFWKDKRVRDLCENPDVRDLLTQLYVTNMAYNITYSNLYCAICNGESIDLLIPWEIDLLKYVTIGLETITTVKKLFTVVSKLLVDNWIYDEQIRNSITSCLRVTNFPPPGIREHIRRCKANVRVCAKDYTNLQVKNNCGTQAHYVYHIGTFKLYRNMDCALCNYVSPDDMLCLDDADTMNMICPPMSVFNDSDKTCTPIVPKLLSDVFTPPTTQFPKVNCETGKKQLAHLCVPERVVGK